MSFAPKEVIWVGSSLEELKEFPDEVQRAMGYALYEVQLGDTPACAKPFHIGQGSGASVMEIVDNFDTDTYRAFYTAKFRDVVYVLCCFQKKSTTGIATPKRVVELVRSRFKWAEADYRQRKGGR